METTRKELKYYGYHACMSLWKKRPNDIIRVYLESTLIPPFSPLLKWCSQQKKAYHIVPTEDLGKITESVHHEGICILALEQESIDFTQMIPTLNPTCCLVYLDGVQNPHNMGSILRLCAHFSIPYLLGSSSQLPALSASACRIAQGGAELVKIIALENAKTDLLALKKAGFTFVATSSHAKRSLYEHKLPDRTLFIFGAEEQGISAFFHKEADSVVSIPGGKQIGSLNVSLAASICLGEYFRQHKL